VKRSGLDGVQFGLLNDIVYRAGHENFMVIADCSSEYPKLNFKPVTSVCNPKVAATNACCAAFNKFACQYRSQVNNFNSICPILFLSYLNYAGGYQDGYFIGKCVDGKKGLCV
jgi:hypothetical protein